MKSMLFQKSLTLLVAAAVFVPLTVTAQSPCPCVLPNVGGTAELMPTTCATGYLGFMNILAGVPAGTTIDMSAELLNFTNTTEAPGGNYGGDIQTFDATLKLTVFGTGVLDGFNRSLQVPVTGTSHSGPRSPGVAVQSFPHEIIAMNGEIFGDPDFCTFRIKAGTANGLAQSIGQTTLTRLGPPGSQFQFDSFFDIFYSVEFQGCPGSILEGMAGTTLDTYLFETCPSPVPVETSTWGTLKNLYE
jgi:hypothetical protein